MKKIKQTTAWLLIRLANKLNEGYFDFGSEVMGMVTFHDQRFVATRKGVFASSDGKKFTRVS